MQPGHKTKTGQPLRKTEGRKQTIVLKDHVIFKWDSKCVYGF